MITFRLAVAAKPARVARSDVAVHDAAVLIGQLHSVNRRRGEPLPFREFYHEVATSLPSALSRPRPLPCVLSTPRALCTHLLFLLLLRTALLSWLLVAELTNDVSYC